MASATNQFRFRAPSTTDSFSEPSNLQSASLSPPSINTSVPKDSLNFQQGSTSAIPPEKQSYIGERIIMDASRHGGKGRNTKASELARVLVTPFAPVLSSGLPSYPPFNTAISNDAKVATFALIPKVNPFQRDSHRPLTSRDLSNDAREVPSEKPGSQDLFHNRSDVPVDGNETLPVNIKTAVGEGMKEAEPTGLHVHLPHRATETIALSLKAMVSDLNALSTGLTGSMKTVTSMKNNVSDLETRFAKHDTSLDSSWNGSIGMPHLTKRPKKLNIKSPDLKEAWEATTKTLAEERQVFTHEIGKMKGENIKLYREIELLGERIIQLERRAKPTDSIVFTKGNRKERLRNSGLMSSLWVMIGIVITCMAAERYIHVSQLVEDLIIGVYGSLSRLLSTV